MDFAASQLDNRIVDTELAKALLGIIPKDLPPDQADYVATLKRIYLEPQVQLDALRAAATAIRDLSIEERLVSARASAAAAAGADRVRT
ncbi:hypothetical protein O4H52_08050 [Sphingomonadaceae bacterium G21617-S1]|nr:hypothetical protein [Sphingomonadaceae bacterium G21617-S1]